MPAIPEPPERIAGELVDLRMIAEWDIPEVLIAHQDDPDLHRSLGMARPPTGAQLGLEVEQAQARRLAGAQLSLSILEPGCRDCRGRVDIDRIDWERASARVRVWVAPQLRGRGYEQQAAELAAEWLRAGCGLRELDVRLLT
ncbi:GNAT family N-acetyltransferase [Conexibacter sp. S30A1]|uniref:GNAT family N-acetyltransferase n=1 Tax=Conexibacter sp. S30A1 TaxID=2937800 RepID=UPI00200F7246|nr:GNAT family N-acetyltransferase [Conexibacter sp. S30A1]